MEGHGIPDVAPFAGAWIEIDSNRPNGHSSCRSHPSRVRGLEKEYSLFWNCLGKITLEKIFNSENPH